MSFLDFFSLFKRTNTIIYRLSPRSDQKAFNVVSNLDDLADMIDLNRAGGVEVIWDANPEETGTNELIIDKTIDFSQVRWSTRLGTVRNLVFTDDAKALGLRDIKDIGSNYGACNIVSRNPTVSPINLGRAYNPAGDGDERVSNFGGDLLSGAGVGGQGILAEVGAAPVIHHHGQRFAVMTTGRNTGPGSIDLADGQAAPAPIVRLDQGAPLLMIAAGGWLAENSLTGNGRLIVARPGQPAIADQRFSNQHSSFTGQFILDSPEQGTVNKVGSISDPANTHDGSQFITVDTSANDVELVLPNAALWAGMAIQCVDKQGTFSTNSFSLSYEAANVITVDADNTVITVQSDGSAWLVTQNDVIGA